MYECSAVKTERRSIVGHAMWRVLDGECEGIAFCVLPEHDNNAEEGDVREFVCHPHDQFLAPAGSDQE